MAKSDTGMSFEEAMVTLGAVKAGPGCVICEHPDRDKIEYAKKAKGVPFQTIADALQLQGFYGGVTRRTAAEHVGGHFHTHMEVASP